MIHKIFDKFVLCYTNKDWWGFFKLCLLLLPVIGILTAGAVLIVDFIATHFDTLIFLASAIILGAGFFYTSKPKDEELPKTDNQGSGANSILFFDKILYRGMFQIFKDYSQHFRVIPPTSFADLRDDLPSAFDTAKGCNLYRLKILSDGEPIDQGLFQELLTSRIEAKLADGSLSLGKMTVEFQQRLYPKVFVDEVTYIAGAWHIALIICDSQNAANYIDSKSAFSNLYINDSHLIVRDSDFE